jgi:hypothetical protein
MEPQHSPENLSPLPVPPLPQGASHIAANGSGPSERDALHGELVELIRLLKKQNGEDIGHLV